MNLTSSRAYPFHWQINRPQCLDNPGLIRVTFIVTNMQLSKKLRKLFWTRTSFLESRIKTLSEDVVFLWPLWNPQWKLFYKVKHKVLLYLVVFLTADKSLEFCILPSLPFCAVHLVEKGDCHGDETLKRLKPLLRNSTKHGYWEGG